ncbi:hypothetical protein [Neobacillus sp. PS3-40]|nr:hypothetical protein [Neobacillus sp. PS3-40]WML44489.1 hypothetical protein RCG20_00810 [Neobacillus sp. PS3-40]
MLTGDQLFEFDEVGIIIHTNEMCYFDNKKLDYVKNALGNGKFQLDAI